MNFKTTIVLLVVLAGVGAYLFVTRETGNAPEKQQSEAAANKVIDIKSEDVTKIAILPAAGKPTVFEKSGSDWKMIKPIEVPAETFEVDSLVRDVVGMTSRGQMDASKEASAGLTKPPYTIEVTAKDKTTKIQIGDKPPFGDDLAVLVEGHDKPDIVSASLYSRLEKKPGTYRKTRLVNVNNDDIKQLVIAAHGAAPIRLKKTGSDWEIVSPRTMPADSSSVESLLYGITGLNAAGFDDTLSPADAGLVKPRLVITYSTQAPSTQPSTLPATSSEAELPGATTIKLGGYEDVDRKNVYASIDGGSIAKIPASTLDTFKKTPLDLRDKKVIDIEPDRVESLAIEMDHPAATRPAEHRSIVIERRKESSATQPAAQQSATHRTAASSQPAMPAGRWVFRSGDEGNVDETAVKTLLDALHPLRAEKFMESAPTTRPTATYSITIHAGPGSSAGPADYIVRLTDPGGEQKLIGTYNDLTFEADRAIAKDLDADFKAKKP